MCALAGCGGSTDPEVSDGGRKTVRPPDPQLLAFASEREVGVVRGGTLRVLAREDAPAILVDLQWSADGRQLGWLTRPAQGPQRLTVVDVESGRRHRYPVAYGMLAPGLTGIAMGSYRSAFTEYGADGRQTRYGVQLAPGASERKDMLRFKTRFTTSVEFAVPRDGAWLVAASLDQTQTEGSSYKRIYRYAPLTGKLTALDRRRRPAIAVDAPIGVDGSVVVWAGFAVTDLGPNCDGPSDRLQTPTGPMAEFPTDPGWRWRVREIELDRGAVAVIARRIRPPSLPDTFPCEVAPEGLERLVLRGGRWSVIDRAVVSLTTAKDGRVARVNGVAGPLARPDGQVELTLGTARVTVPGQDPIALPSGTLKVLFSPARPSTGFDSSGMGPALSEKSRLSSTGLGRLRFGMSAIELQRVTSTPLRIVVDDDGCGTVGVQDETLGGRLGVVGGLAGGKLQSIVVTSRDTRLKEDEAGLEDDLRPGVRSVAPRGPSLAGGIRAGDNMSELFGDFGRPAKVRDLATPGAHRQEYSLDDGVRLLADADGRGTIRRLELRSSAAAC